jgi:hypothetical protein
MSHDVPPGWDKRAEGWTIDELLGCYDALEQKITIFDKGVKHAAGQLGSSPNHLEYVVRIHEWAHAIFHLGVTAERSAALAKASVDNDEELMRVATKELTRSYLSVDSYVHEQIAQAITWLALGTLRAKATVVEAKQTCELLCETFGKLARRQPPEYQLDHLHLADDRLRSRLRAVIQPIRNGDVRGNRRTWDTIMPW